MYVCLLEVTSHTLTSETASVVTKKNPHKKHYGLSRLPVDRKQAYLQETAAQQDQSITRDQCEVEYDSDNDEDINDSKMDVGNSHSISNIETKPERSTDSDHDKHTSVHEHTETFSSINNGDNKDLNVKATDKLAADNESQPTVLNSTTEDNSKDVISPKRTKMIGPSLGPLRKRRRRSSEVCMCVYVCLYLCVCISVCGLCMYVCMYRIYPY